LEFVLQVENGRGGKEWRTLAIEWKRGVFKKALFSPALEEKHKKKKKNQKKKKKEGKICLRKLIARAADERKVSLPRKRKGGSSGQTVVHEKGGRGGPSNGERGGFTGVAKTDKLSKKGRKNHQRSSIHGEGGSMTSLYWGGEKFARQVLLRSIPEEASFFG